MTTWNPQANDLFLQALELRSAGARQEYLDQACASDAALRAEVESLLEASARAGRFLESPVPAPHLLATVDDPISERPGTTIGPYKLLEQLGEGGFGVVFLAEQTHPVRRKIAMKILKPGMDTKQVIGRFEAERQALAIMDHANIAKVFDGGVTESGRPWFVMELVKGVSITAFCDQNQVAVRERLELFVHVCEAVQHAHQKGIIHRDLKPSNVLVTMQDKPVVKVIDFGVAKALGQELTDKTLFTGFAQMIGTPLYMPPEQAGQSGLDVDTRSDIYSLGVLLYELLTGTTPFDKERLRTAAYDEIRRIIREEEPPKPSTRMSNPGQAARTVSANRKSDAKRLGQLFRGELDWIVMKALEKDRNRRYETASAFAADVQRYLHDEPVQACPPSVAYRFGKFARRNKAGLMTGTVAALALCVAAGALVVSNIRISGESAEKAKALEAATTSEREAQQSLEDALAAVDQMLTRVSEERLRDMPQMEPLRRELLQDALKFYQRFLARRGEDPAIRRETGLAYLRLASLHFGLGDYRKSEEAYRKALAMLDELHVQSPLEPSIRSELVSYSLGFAWVLGNQGKYEDGEKVLRRAVTAAEELLKEFPHSRSYRDQVVTARNRLASAIVSRGLLADAQPTELEEAEQILQRNLVLTLETTSFWDRAQTYQNLGVVLGKQSRFSQAEDACRQGVLLFEKALAKSPSSRWMQVELAGTLNQLARMVDTNGRPEEAETIYQRAVPLFDKFAGDFPAGPHNRWGQADVHFQHAWLLSKLKRFAEAEQAYRRAVELSDKLAHDFPTLPGYRWTAVGRRGILAQFLMETGRVQEAQQVAAGAAEMLEKLSPAERSKALVARGHFYGGLGEWDKAIADFAKAIDLGSDDVMGAWYPLAVLYLRAQRTNEYSSLCEKLLKQFRQTEDHFVVVICKLAPNAVADLSQPVHVAQKLVARKPRNAEIVGLLGAALYRKGDVKAAVARLEEGIRLGSLQIGVQWRRLVLAMAYHRLGRGPEARQLFEQVTHWIEQNAQKQLSWAFRLDLQLLHHEAEVLLKQHVGGKSRQSEKK